jgi:hypothetical protein
VAKKKKEDVRKKKFLHFVCRNVSRRSLSICSQAFLPSACLCGHLYESSYRFGVEILVYTKREYNLDDQVLDTRSVFQCACNVMIYLALI